MSLRHPKPAPATPSAGKRAGALPIRCELLLVATLEDAGDLVGQFECPLIRQLQRQMGTDRWRTDAGPTLASKVCDQRND